MTPDSLKVARAAYPMGVYAFIEAEAPQTFKSHRVPVFLSMNSYRFFRMLNLHLKVQGVKSK